jgi:hypothetical protein
VHDGTKRSEKTVPLLQGASVDFPATPKVPAEVMQEFK